MPIFIVIAIAAMVSGGVVAQQATPGDVLYPVKVEVNEKIGASLHFSAKAKAEYEAKLAARRLEEAAELAAEGELDAEAEADVEARFHNHSDAFKARIAEVEAEGDAEGASEVASRFEAALEAHNQVLLKLQEKDVEVKLIQGDITGEVGAIADLRLKLESKVTARSFSGAEGKAEVKTAAEGKITAATNVIASARSYVQRYAEKLGAEATADAEVRLQAAEKLIVDAQAKVTAEAYAEAFALASEALRTAQKARVLVETRNELKVDIDAEAERNSTVEGEVRVQSGVEIKTGL